MSAVNVENSLAKTTASFNTINSTLEKGFKSAANMRKASVNSLLWINKTFTIQVSFMKSANMEKPSAKDLSSFIIRIPDKVKNGFKPSGNVLSLFIVTGLDSFCEGPSAMSSRYVRSLQELHFIYQSAHDPCQNYASFCSRSHLFSTTWHVFITCISYHNILREDRCLCSLPFSKRNQRELLAVPISISEELWHWPAPLLAQRGPVWKLLVACKVLSCWLALLVLCDILDGLSSL